MMMKNLKFLILIVPVTMMISCNSGNQRDGRVSDSRDSDSRDTTAVIGPYGDRNNDNSDFNTRDRDNSGLNTRDRDNSGLNTRDRDDNSSLNTRDRDNSGLSNSDRKVGGAASASESNRDEDFAEEAFSGGLYEIQAGQFVQQNATNPRVKNFAAMMARDHQKASDELKRILSTKNIDMPASMEDNHRDMLDDLKKKSGSELDADYMKEMINDHNKDVDKFKKYAENGDDPELKSFAAKQLPVLLMHHDSAQKIQESLDRNKSNR